MKIYHLTILIGLIFGIGNYSKAQNKLHITISLKDKSLSNSLTEIEKKYNIIFSYNSNLISNKDRVTIAVQNEQLENFLPKILPSDVTFRIYSNNVLLLPKKKSSPKKQIRKLINNKTLTSTYPDSIYIQRIDTIYIQKTDTIFVQKTDTIELTEQYIEPIKNIISEKKLDNKLQFELGLMYQFMVPTLNYYHFGVSDFDKKAKRILDASEKSINQQRFGITSSLLINKQLKISSGLALTKYNETYDFNNYRDSLGSVLKVNTDTSTNLIGSNSYTYISVPLSVGWQFNITKKIRITPTVGAWFNFISSTRGLYLDLNRSDILTLSNLSDAPLSKLTTELLFHLSLDYQIYKGFTLQIAPTYTHQIGSDFMLDYPISKNKMAFGVNFSIISIF